MKEQKGRVAKSSLPLPIALLVHATGTQPVDTICIISVLTNNSDKIVLVKGFVDI